MAELSFELHFGTDLATADVVDFFQDVLRERSPTFSRDLRVLDYERDRDPRIVDVDRGGALLQAAIEKGSHRGDLYQRLSEENAPIYPRRFGSVLLRSRVRSTFMRIQFDEHVPGKRSGDRWLFSNGLGGWIGAAHVDRKPRSAWLIDVASSLVDHPDFLWGAAFLREEFRARNLDETDGVRAMGRDMRRSLPGLYWLNFFGRPYVELIGAELLRTVPAHHIVALGDTMLVRICDSPEDWNRPDIEARRVQALDHLGHEYFFDRDHPDRPTKTVDFGLERLDPKPPLEAVVSEDGSAFTVLPVSDQ